MANGDEIREKLHGAINDCFILQGGIDHLNSEISRLAASIEKDEQELKQLRKVETRKAENEKIANELREELSKKQNELDKIISFLEQNNVKLPFSGKQNKQTKI